MITYYLLFIDAQGDTVESIALDAKTEAEANSEHFDLLCGGIGDGIEYVFTVVGTEMKFTGSKPEWTQADLDDAIAAAHAADLEEDLAEALVEA